jgi:leucyl-tRNA synthetase
MPDISTNEVIMATIKKKALPKKKTTPQTKRTLKVKKAVKAIKASRVKKTTKAAKAPKASAVKKKSAVAKSKAKPKATAKRAVARPRKASQPKTAPIQVIAKPEASKEAVVPVKAAKPTAAHMPQAVKKIDVYNPQSIEPKWQKKWEADGLYHSDINPQRPKHYALTMLPYPSGDLHIGHWYAMTPSDARARFMRMCGYNVLFPIGFDAFGLPAENAAIQRNVHPKEWTYKNIENMRRQLRSMGAMFDWRREAVSADPEYYKWTEWFFVQLFKHGLAYRKMSPVDFCPNCNTTLAREQVWGEDRHCERCGTPVIKKDLEQWFFRTTKYADELLDYDNADWPERVRTLQTNWIGRSEGASVVFKLSPLPDSSPTSEGGEEGLEIFTTRPDTLWGATFMVLAPEHPLVDVITSAAQKTAVEAYKLQASRQSDIEREAVDKEKTGVFTGGYAINPVNGEKIPVWIADYVLMTYGTGAIMAVPAHDERDFAFARKHGLKIIPVIQPEGEADLDGDTMTEAYVGPGVMVNSGQFNGTKVNDEKGRKNPGITAVTDWLERQGIGKFAVTYKLRDWLISRQRYWGAPIPMIRCEKHGWNPVPEGQLPVLLPDDVEWKPTGESPLKLHPTWKNASCPVCGEPAVRETDTMDTFMCSSWYHLRYLSPHYDKGPFDEAEYNYWMPVDTYTGGIEHANMHLIYTRFFHKALRDMGIAEGPEPMMQLRNQGMVLGEDNEKMSKSRGNVIAPDELVRRYGADTVRAYLMFFARWDMGGPWNSKGIEGSARWLKRVWAMFTEPNPTRHAAESPETRKVLRRKVHQTLKRVTRDFEQFEFNTIISSLMELLNDMQKAREAGAAGTSEWGEALDIYLHMLAPVCPHIAEELWTNVLHKPYSVHTQAWPRVDEAAAAEDEITLAVQVNGKVRDRVTLPADASDEDVRAAALAAEGVTRALGGRQPKKVIVVKGKLVSVVV